MRQRNAEVEEGADPLKYEVRRRLRFIRYSDDGHTADEGHQFAAGDFLRVMLRNGCGQGIDVVRESDGYADMVHPEEVELAEERSAEVDRGIRVAAFRLLAQKRRSGRERARRLAELYQQKRRGQ